MPAHLIGDHFLADLSPKKLDSTVFEGGDSGVSGEERLGQCLLTRAGQVTPGRVAGELGDWQGEVQRKVQSGEQRTGPEGHFPAPVFSYWLWLACRSEGFHRDLFSCMSSHFLGRPSSKMGALVAIRPHCASFPPV